MTALAGPCAATLAKLLDGTRDLQGILREASGELTVEQAANGVRQLAEAGFLTHYSDLDATVAPGVLAYWDAAGLDGSDAVRHLAASRVALVSLSPGAGDVAEALRRTGVGKVDSADIGADLAVVLCDDYLDPGLEAIAAACGEKGTPWLLAKPTGTELWLGPVFTRGDGACWHCLAERVGLHRRARAALRCSPQNVGIPPATAATAQLIALEAAKWLAGVRYHGQKSIWIQDSLSLASRHHPVTVRPQCGSCGDPGLMEAQAKRPVTLVSRPKAAWGAGGHRSATAEDTLRRFGDLISPVTGIVERIVPDSRGPRFFNCYRSGPNLALRARSLQGLQSVLRATSGGKGVSALDAEVGALGEAAERFSAAFHADEYRISAGYREVEDRAIHPDACQLYDARQYRDRDEWNRAHGWMLSIPEPLDERAVIDWTPLWSLTREEHRLLPTSLLYFGAPGPCLADSSGNAVGAALEDAVLQGLLEVIERDAVSLWWDNRLRMPGFDLDDLGDPWIDEHRQVHADLGRDVWVLDITADLPVPTMAAFSRSVRGPERIMFGFGAHLDPAVAVRRALTEVNQAMPWVVDDPEESGDPDFDRWLGEGASASCPYLLPDQAVPARRRVDHAFQERFDLAADVRHLQSLLESAGMEVLVLDQTRPDVGLSAVKVVVPGMRPIWARYAPGRLYDVPVKLGLRTEPTPYEELNPVPLWV
nr:TOMM precursor leader peptide-binding protein [Actinocorallia populi]